MKRYRVAMQIDEIDDSGVDTKIIAEIGEDSPTYLTESALIGLLKGVASDIEPSTEHTFTRSTNPNTFIRNC